MGNSDLKKIIGCPSFLQSITSVNKSKPNLSTVFQYYLQLL